MLNLIIIFLEYKDTPAVSSEYKLFCKNLPFDVTAKELADLFDDVQEIRIVYDKKTEKCKGYVSILIVENVLIYNLIELLLSCALL